MLLSFKLERKKKKRK